MIPMESKRPQTQSHTHDNAHKAASFSSIGPPNLQLDSTISWYRKNAKLSGKRTNPPQKASDQPMYKVFSIEECDRSAGKDSSMGTFLGRSTSQPESLRASSVQNSSLKPYLSPLNRPGTSHWEPSRHYFLEKLSHFALHTKKAANNTWQFPGDEEIFKKTAKASRNDVVDLTHCYDSVLEFLTRKNANAPVDNRWRALREDLRLLQAQAHTQAFQTSENEVTELSLVCLQHKWSDLILGELEGMLTLSFVEQGALLRKARSQSAQAFDRVETLCSSLAQRNQRTQRQLDGIKCEFQAQKEEQIAALEGVRRDCESMVSVAISIVEKEKEELRRQLQEARQKITTMNESMRTLTTLYREIRQDTEKFKVIELKEAFAKLQENHEALREEKKWLDTTSVMYAEVLAEREESKLKLLEAQKQLQRKDKLLQAKEDLLKKLLAEQSRFLADKELLMSHRGQPDSEEQSNISSEDAKAPRNASKQRHCLHYQILLPSVHNRSSKSDSSWTLAAIRSIYQSKIIDDLASDHLSGSLQCRVPMPEFVYAWFERWKPPECSGKTTDETTRRQLLKEADQDRWRLYYGAKDLKLQNCVEAKLFLSLLAESNGEDGQSLFLYCYSVLNVLAQGHLPIGSVCGCHSYQDFSQMYEASCSPPDIENTVRSIPSRVWISPFHVMLATSIVMIRAPRDDYKRIESLVIKLAVHSVPKDELPVLYLTPAAFVGNTDHFLSLLPIGADGIAVNGSLKLHGERWYIDASRWLELMMFEYREEQAHRRATIRVMFQTAAFSSSSRSNGEASTSEFVEMGQFQEAARALNCGISLFMSACLYRRAFDLGNGAVTYDSFLIAAEQMHFFSSCMRLESPAATLARLIFQASGPKNDKSNDTDEGGSHAMYLNHLTTNSRACHAFQKMYTYLQHQLVDTIGHLPVCIRSTLNALACDITRLFNDTDNRGLIHDAASVVLSFQNFLTFHFVVQFTKRKATGEVFSASIANRTLEKALLSLLECVRVQKKTKTERIVDLVRQKVSVCRLQVAFRAHLDRKCRVPLPIRQLMSLDYVKNTSGYDIFTPNRSEKWLYSVVTDIFRNCVSMLPQWKVEQHATPADLVLQFIQSESLGARSASDFCRASFSGRKSLHPPKLFPNFVYDYCLSKVGTRQETEKMVHDVYLLCSGVLRNETIEDEPMGGKCNRIRLFAWLSSFECKAPSFCPNEALIFMLSLAQVFCTRSQVAWALPIERDEISVTHLVRTDHRKAKVPFSVAVSVLSSAFHPYDDENKLRISNRLCAAAETPSLEDEMGHIDLDALLMIAMEEWKQYLLHRMRAIVLCSESKEHSCPSEYLAQRSHSMILTEKILRDANVAYEPLMLGMIGRRLSNLPRISIIKTSGQEVWSRVLYGEYVAAAGLPLIATEILCSLDSLMESKAQLNHFHGNYIEQFEYLRSFWDAYKMSCQSVLEDLQASKNHQNVAAVRRTCANLKEFRSLYDRLVSRMTHLGQVIILGTFHEQTGNIFQNEWELLRHLLILCSQTKAPTSSFFEVAPAEIQEGKH
uniref:Uncharacterized protein AlNc14C141G7267 n=1 Tax=Albugo laibachii Nc14 TaxID=890382 RepID=F0WL79_9STRA|nr:conserved hypothetical protein [Albugo laibachii Nc14]|eukprot:CCA22040.1 conserved hypothetical protein [Albugo laibachii Nc14]